MSHTTNFFKDLGVDTFRLETDVNGNCLGSSFGWATARDWARLGLLYMYDGFWWDIETIIPDSHDRTKQILPDGWVDFTKTPVKTSNGVYGAQFWLGGNNTALLDDDTISARHREKECDEIFPTRLSPSRDWMKHLPNGSFFMHGFEEQAVIIHQGEPKTGKPSFVLVRLGATKEKVLKWDKSKFYRDIFDSIH